MNHTSSATQHAHANQMTNSHLLNQDFDYYEASSVEQALAWLEQYGSQARLLAGGTDLLVLMKMNRISPAAIININKIPGLDAIRVNPLDTSKYLSIGPLVTIHTLATHPFIRTTFPGLSMACSSFGSTQVEQMGTIGGNLCNGSPAADTAPVLLTLGAELTLASRHGKRTLPLESFFVGPGKTALQPGEILVEITLPLPQPGSTSVFLKSTRVVADLAKASLAIALTRAGELITDCRVAMGSVAPTPILLPETAKALVGQTFSADCLAEAGKTAAGEISPIDDIRSSAWYRRQIARVMLHDGMTLAWEQSTHPNRACSAFTPPPATEQKYALLDGALNSGQPQEVELQVNGRTSRVRVTANQLLLNVLREELELTGTKYACGIGECGACTVQVDGKSMLSCLILAVSASGKKITTVEGLQDAKTGALDPLQQAFIDNTAFQCGYCTPGILMTAKTLLNETPHPTEEQVRDYLRGNHCRCTGYASIVRAVLDAAERAGG